MLKEQGVTINEALQMEPLKTSRLIAGEKGEGKIITKVNIMADYEIVDWVGEGELLLTTTIALGSNNGFNENLVAVLHSKGLSGLAVKTGGDRKDIDRHLVESANHLGFPLIELDPGVPLSDIINTLSSHISNRQAAIIMKLERTHKNLMEIVLNGGGMKEIAKMIYKITGNPVMIKDKIFGVWEGEDGGPNSQLPINDLLPIVYREDRISNRFNKNVREPFESADNINGRIVNHVAVPILAANNIYGYILLWEVNKPIGTLDYRVLETASTVIALEIMKRMSVYQVESRYRMEFLENLLSRDPSMQNLALERGSFYGWSQRNGYIVMIVGIESSEPVKKGKKMTAKDIFNYYKNSMVREIEAILKAENEKALIGEKSDSIILLLGADENTIANEINEKSLRIGEKIINAMDAKFYKTKAIVGIGRYYENTRELWKSYQEARKAITLGMLDTDSRVINFDRLGIYRLLSHEGLDEELMLFYKSTIYPLVEYDRKRNTDFIPTLKVYFETDGNLKKMADILYTHYNTVLYRLQRIQKIAGIDIKSASDRLNLEIGLKILNIFECSKAKG